MGAGDGFLQLEVKTRNARGIAPHSPLVANFGLEWDGDTAAGSTESEPAAKKMKGALDQYFISKAAACPPSVQEDDSQEAGANEDNETAGKDKEAEVKAARDAAEKEAKDRQEAEKAAQAGSKLEVGSKLSDGGKVVAMEAVSGAFLIWREEGTGSLSLRAGEQQTGNKKIPPKTFLWKIPAAKCSSQGGLDSVAWSFANPKAIVHSSVASAFTTLGDLAKAKGAIAVAKHSPVFAVGP